MLVVQLCAILCDPKDCNLPSFFVHGVLQARILEWVVIPSPGNLPDPGIEPTSPASPVSQADSLLAELPGTPMGGQRKWFLKMKCTSGTDTVKAFDMTTKDLLHKLS